MTTASDIRKLDLSVLRGKLSELELSLAKEKLDFKMQKSKNVRSRRDLRHEIARVKLIIGEKELLG